VKYIFVDNFRGFARTLLSIRDVNFFVGENSTGKTSLLALISLLNSPYFWFEQRFSTNEVKLGMFKDIVSVGSQNKDYFSIGLANIIPKKGKAKNGDESHAYLFTFVEEEGMPIINHYTTVMMGEEIHVHFSRKSAKYKDEGTCNLVDDYQLVKGLFLRWADSHQKVGTGYSTIRMPRGVRERRPDLIYAQLLLEDVIRKKQRAAPRRSYYFSAPFGEVVWLAPIRTRPQRTYDAFRLDFSPEGEHTPYLIKKLLARRTPTQREQSERFLRFIEKFGKDSGLFKSISTKNYEPKITTSPFELDIILAKEGLSIDNVGYGVSQALPVIVEIFDRPKDTWFNIQQPEIHLHPRAQTALGELIFELASLENKKFILETHSDFIVDGFRLRYKNDKTGPKPSAHIVFFARNDGGNNMYEIDILENGEISDDQPSAYREFFVKEQMRLLGLQSVHSD
jgi:hypothetical protein